jgi:hypothetical protein
MRKVLRMQPRLLRAALSDTVSPAMQFRKIYYKSLQADCGATSIL